MRRFSTLVGLLVLLIALPVLTSADSPLAGTWKATFADSLTSGTVYLTLTVDTGGSVSGTYRATTGGFGKVSGKWEGETFNFTLTQSVEDCPGVYVGSLVLEDGRGTGTYTGNTCLGSHENGVVSMVRAKPEELSAQTASEEKTQLSVEYGKPEELREIRTVYVYTGLDLRSREDILRELKRYKGITVVENSSDADVILIFGTEINIPGYVDPNPIRRGVYGTGKEQVGRGWAIRLDKEQNALRIVWQFEDAKSTVWEKRPSTNFARNFIEVLKKVREEK